MSRKPEQDWGVVGGLVVFFLAYAVTLWFWWYYYPEIK